MTEKRHPKVDRARRFFVRANMAFNASTTKVGYSSDSLRNTPKPVTFASKVDRLTEIAQRLRTVELQNIDALRLIDIWDGPDTALYLDPPYLDDTRSSTGDYATDNGGTAFHEALVERMKKFSGNAVLSGYAHPLYEELGWLRIEVDVQAGSSGTGRRTECLWVNYL